MVNPTSPSFLPSFRLTSLSVQKRLHVWSDVRILGHRTFPLFCLHLYIHHYKITDYRGDDCPYRSQDLNSEQELLTVSTILPPFFTLGRERIRKCTMQINLCNVEIVHEEGNGHLVDIPPYSSSPLCYYKLNP